ncbi:hypothetical protein AX16_000828 [Volvariella volvacea WC 439]|nr:hypothetical protein AX16_000828 [Volvariella volvacea WC 439]
MKASLFDLCIDMGRQVVEIKGDDDFLAFVKPGVTVVMRVIVAQRVWYYQQQFNYPLYKTPYNIKNQGNSTLLWCILD